MTYTGSGPDMFADVEDLVRCEEIESTRCCGVVVEDTELSEFSVEDEDVMPVLAVASSSSSGAFVELDRLLSSGGRQRRRGDYQLL